MFKSLKDNMRKIHNIGNLNTEIEKNISSKVEKCSNGRGKSTR